MAVSIGTRLGPYLIEAALGAGGMGEVYKARDTRLDRIVAIKVLPAELAGDPAFRERFDREARAISALNHPHICTLYDVGRQDPSTSSGGTPTLLVTFDDPARPSPRASSRPTGSGSSSRSGTPRATSS